MTGTVAPHIYGQEIAEYDVLDNVRRRAGAPNGVGGYVQDYRYQYDTSQRLDRIDNEVGALQWDFAHNGYGETTTRSGHNALWSYQWNATGRMTQASRNGTARPYLPFAPDLPPVELDPPHPEATTFETYVYDAHGRRTRSSRSDGSTRHQVYSRAGQSLYLEDTKDNQRIDYLHLGNKLIAQRSRPLNGSTATVTYHHTDHIGSANVETNAYGSQTERTTRMPYGSAYDGIYREGPGYAGHVTDSQTNLTYMEQRYYDSVALRFLSPDPVDVSASDGGNFNRYWYGHNNPYRFVDPDGRLSQFAKANSDWLTQIDDPNVGEDQAMFDEALDRELSRLFGTPMGETMKEAAIAKSGLILRTNNEFMNEAALNSGKINIDPLFKATADTTDGRQQSSLAAIIAHELGHALFWSR